MASTRKIDTSLKASFQLFRQTEKENKLDERYCKIGNALELTRDTIKSQRGLLHSRPDIIQQVEGHTGQMERYWRDIAAGKGAPSNDRYLLGAGEYQGEFSMVDLMIAILDPLCKLCPDQQAAKLKEVNESLKSMKDSMSSAGSTGPSSNQFNGTVNNTSSGSGAQFPGAAIQGGVNFSSGSST